MDKVRMQWTLSHAAELGVKPQDQITAQVPGAVQLDYGKAFSYPPYWYGQNYKQYLWMEDEYFFYDTCLDFSCEPQECAVLWFGGIDYRYEISLGEKVVCAGEGAFTPVAIDVTAYSGKKTPLRVTIFPIPKIEGVLIDRSNAARSCKPASSYGWDWHPHLVPTGIWEDACVQIYKPGEARSLEVSYRLSEDLKKVTVTVDADIWGGAPAKEEGINTQVLLEAPDGTIAASQIVTCIGGVQRFVLELDNPSLWYPRGYGEQPRYTLKVGGMEKKIGFRRAKLLLNEGAEQFEAKFPKGPMPAPMSLEINGQKVFVKGSNMVNTEIFPVLATKERYEELIDLACKANMNIFRLWGGQYIKKESFYDRCDEVGMMVWQEFMLSCNNYPDEDHYLEILKQEATTIIKRLRTHPCLAFWCGGNELFNTWSGMTNQAHPLRLLDSLCYQLDRFTPFQMTSPVHGVSHGTYTKTVIPSLPDGEPDYERGEEYLSIVQRNLSTAYTEFGCCGAATHEYITKYIMSEEDYQNCSAANDVWVDHHGFRAWDAEGEGVWLGIPDVNFYFGGYENIDDLVEKSIYLQDMCYQTTFEEMRRHAPLCSMVINWDYNEPWPCAAGNSLVAWPAEPKSCLERVGQALRPTLVSLETGQNRYLTGDTFRGTIWMLNDCAEASLAGSVEAWLVCGEQRTLLAKSTVDAVEPRKNEKFDSFSFEINETIPERFRVELVCPEQDTYSSTYTFVHKK